MKKVLIVIDIEFIRKSLKMMLLRNGFEVIGEADNGSSGIEKYLELKPDLIIIEVCMPLMSGIETMKKIKRYDPNARMLAVYAIGQEAYVHEALSIGAEGFLLKPFREELVINTLRRLR